MWSMFVIILSSHDICNIGITPHLIIIVLAITFIFYDLELCINKKIFDDKMQNENKTCNYGKLTSDAKFFFSDHPDNYACTKPCTLFTKTEIKIPTHTEFIIEGININNEPTDICIIVLTDIHTDNFHINYNTKYQIKINMEPQYTIEKQNITFVNTDNPVSIMLPEGMKFHIKEIYGANHLPIQFSLDKDTEAILVK